MMEVVQNPNGSTINSSSQGSNGPGASNGNNGGTADCFASESSTSLDTIHVMHKWKIENFSVHTELTPVGEALTSTSFGSSTEQQYKFVLRLYPIGKDEECRGYVSLFLQIKDCPTPKARFRVNFFVDTTEGPKGCALNRNIVTINKGGIVTASRFFSVEFLKTRAARFLPEDTLTVGCELYIFGEALSLKREGIRVPIPISTLADNFEDMFKQGHFTDLTLSVGHRQFNVHKAVLMARSTVFRAMFTHDNLKEAMENEVRIEDVKPAAMEALLTHMYGDNLPELHSDDLTEDVLAAADKYNLPRLRAQCEAVLCRDVTPENVCHRLKLAELYTARILEERCMSFLSENFKEILVSEAWSKFEADSPRLASTTLRKVMTASKESSGGRPPAKRQKLM